MKRLLPAWDFLKRRMPFSGKKFTGLLIWLAVILTAWLLARACAFALTPASLPMAPLFSAAAAAPAPGSTMPPFSSYAALQSNNLFNLKSHNRTASGPAAFNAILMGTVEARRPEDTRAIIQHQGKQHTLRPGQEIAGYTVKEIRRDTVLLEGNGRTVELVSANTGDLAPAGNAGEARRGRNPAPNARP